MTDLIVDYSDDWKHVDGVIDCGYTIGPQRVDRNDNFSNITEGVKAKKSSLSQNEIMMVGSSIGIEPNDRAYTIWASTIKDGSAVVPVKNGDFLVVGGTEWRILWNRKVCDDTQYRVLCRETAK